MYVPHTRRRVASEYGNSGEKKAGNMCDRKYVSTKSIHPWMEQSRVSRIIVVLQYLKQNPERESQAAERSHIPKRNDNAQGCEIYREKGVKGEGEQGSQ
jgi:hypothetical protein